MKRILIIAVLAFAAIPCAWAQSTDPLFDMQVHSPEASGLGEYVERPVSYYSGTPQVSIPIHTIRLKDFNFPISLSYHAGGVKVDEVASNVGMGWSLIAGGSIMKVAGNGSESSGPVPVSYPNDYCNFNPNVAVGNETDPDYVFALSATDNNLKTEPDLFNYNFLGNTGKFIRDPLNTDDYYSIPLNNLDISYASGTFTILDDKGIKYEFGAIELTSHAEYPVTSPNGYSPSASYSFNLTKVTLPTGDYIEIEYESNSYAYVSSLREEEYQPSGTNTGCSAPTHFNFPVKSISLVGGLRIKKIKAFGPIAGSLPFMHADFIYNQDSVREDMTLPGDYPGTFSSEARTLESIKIYYLDGGSTTPSHVFNLQQDYTTSIGSGSDAFEQSLRKRLWLTSFQEEGKPAYQFAYNHNNPLPKRLSFGQDYYGYYNGVNGNASTIPNTVTSTTNGADRSVNAAYAKSGMLEKITYPTGGYTTFAFEGNEGGAGLRLSSQKSYGHGNALERELYYTYEDRISRGIPRFHETVTIPNGTNENGEPLADCIWHRNSSGAAPTLTGRYRSFTVGYGRVTEWNGPTGEEGKTIYEFHKNISEIEPTAIYTGAHVSYEWAEGLPKRTTYYANTGSGFSKVKRMNYTYQVTDGLANSCDTSPNGNREQFEVYLIKVSRPPQSATGVVNAQPAEFEVEQQKIITSWQYQSKVEEIDYPSDLLAADSLSKTTDYSYDGDKKVLIGTTMTDSNGQVRMSTFKHPFKYADSTVYDSMVKANILNNPIETRLFVDHKLASSAIVTYKTENGIFVPEHAYRYNYDGPVISDVDSRLFSVDEIWDTNRLEKRATFVHDDHGRLIQQSKDRDIVTSYVWGYNKTVVVAVVQNVDHATVESTISPLGPVEPTENLTTSQVNALRNIPGARVTHYKYDPGYGVTEITDPNNNRVSKFVYDTNGRLIRVLDNNSKVLQQYEYHYKSQN